MVEIGRVERGELNINIIFKYEKFKKLNKWKISFIWGIVIYEYLKCFKLMKKLIIGLNK